MPFGYGGPVETRISDDGFGIEDIRRVVYRPQFDEWDCWAAMEAMVDETVLLALVYPEPWFSYKRAAMADRPAIKQQMIDIIESWQRANSIEWTDEDLRLLVEAMR